MGGCGIWNTIRLNYCYFGFKGLLNPCILASKDIRLQALKGKIIVDNKKFGLIRIGLGYYGVTDGKTNRCTFENTGTLHCRGRVWFNAGTRIINHGTLSVGENTSFNGNVSIICYNRVDIGDNVACSWHCQIMDTDFHRLLDLGTGERLNEDRPVKIGNHVWIGSRCLILKGSEIPDDSVVAAGSIVTKQLIETHTVYVSNKPIRHNIDWEL